MESYRVIIRKKIPFLSEFLFALVTICCIILGICLLLFMPALNSSNEMKVVTSIAIIPDYVKWLILSSGVGFVLFYFLYKHILLVKKGTLRLNATNISITNKKNIFQIPIGSISSIELIDPTNMNDIPRGKFFIIINPHNFLTFQCQLADYTDADSFIDDLFKYEDLKSRIKSPVRLYEPDILDPDG